MSEYRIITYKCGDNARYWTFRVIAAKKLLNSTPIIYRMYDKEITAMRNGIKLLAKRFAPKPTTKKKKK